MALALAAAVPQAAVDEREAPQTSLLRAYETFESHLCRRRDAARWRVRLAKRYANRMRAVHEAVAHEYGSQEADRGYVTVAPCHAFRSDRAFRQAMGFAATRFEGELTSWEGRYGLTPPTGGH